MTPVDPSGSATPTSVPVFDEFGRQLFVPLETWRTTMLPSILEKANDDPDQLYNAILSALNLHLAADVRAAAERLTLIDPSPERSTTIHAIVLMKVGNPTAAARILNAYLDQHGSSGVILTNLAKALTELNRSDEADATLWRALQADPNQENALEWYGSIQRDRHGAAGWDQAMQHVAILPNTWRPQVWLARSALDRNETAQAIALYRQALDRAGTPAPVVLLQSMSGDLGKHGLLSESLDLTLPSYDAAIHGLAVGNNLVKAALESGHPDQARAFVDQLYKQHRPDWASTLNYWESQIKAQQLATAPPSTPPNLVAYSFDGPIWLPPDSPLRKLFPDISISRAKIAFLGSTVSTDASRPAGPELPDRSGRLTRAVPLFLSESAFLDLQLDTTTILPWVEHHGFALLGAPWSDSDAIDYARSHGATAIVVTHLLDSGDSQGNFTLSLRLLNARNDLASPLYTLMFEIATSATWHAPQDAAIFLAASLRAALSNLFGKPPAPPTTLDSLPNPSDLGDYLLRLEQLLAVRSSNIADAPQGFLIGEREIISGQLALAIRAPNSLPARLILHATLRAMRTLKPEIAEEFRKPAELLQQRYPLSEPQTNTLLTTQLESIYAPAKTETQTNPS